jgi:hypothetical protein
MASLNAIFGAKETEDEEQSRTNGVYRVPRRRCGRPDNRDEATCFSFLASTCVSLPVWTAAFSSAPFSLCPCFRDLPLRILLEVEFGLSSLKIIAQWTRETNPRCMCLLSYQSAANPDT